MYGVFIEVDADDSLIEQARKLLPEVVAPTARDAGARAGYWLAPQNGRGVSVTVYDDEETARAFASSMTVGSPGPVEGVTIRTVEVREVLAHL
jgi:hypothetical protein